MVQQTCVVVVEGAKKSRSREDDGEKPFGDNRNYVIELFM
jgi:hypothetical protein